jgi:hypothetical protein
MSGSQVHPAGSLSQTRLFYLFMLFYVIHTVHTLIIIISSNLAFNKIYLETRINLLHVLAPGYHHQGFTQNSGE